MLYPVVFIGDPEHTRQVLFPVEVTFVSTILSVWSSNAAAANTIKTFGVISLVVKVCGARNVSFKGSGNTDYMKYH